MRVHAQPGGHGLDGNPPVRPAAGLGSECAAEAAGAISRFPVLQYRKQKFGPCASFLRSAVTDLEAAGRIRQSREWYYGSEKFTFTSLAAVPASRLSESERALLGEVIEFVCRNNPAKSISDFSHARAWDAACLGQVMSYDTAMNIVAAELADDDLSWAITKAANVANEESRGAPVQRRGHAAFRGSLRSNPR